MAVLVMILVVMTVLGVLHQMLKFGKAPVGVDALCPFGAIESAFTLIATGKFIQRIEISSVILLVAVLVTALIFRRAFCGYICPLGTLQELFARLGNRLFGRRYTMPHVVDRPARYLKYLVLVLTVIFSAHTAELVIRPYDPWAAYQHLTSNEVLTEFRWGLVALAVTLIGSAVFDRFFCKYLCPMGAFLALISPVSLTKVRRNRDTCVHCSACDRACPVNIKVSEKLVVSSAECINCDECVNRCPVADTLYIGNSGRLRTTSRVAIITTVAIFLLAISVTTATRTFRWTTVSLSEQIGSPDEFDPAMIRGKMTLHDVVTAAGVPAQVVIDRFGFKGSDFYLPMKNLHPKYGIGTEDIRDFLTEYLDKEPGSESAQAAPDKKQALSTITGKMTLREVSVSSGITTEVLAARFGVKDQDLDTPIRDIKDKYGFSTNDVRDFMSSKQD